MATLGGVARATYDLGTNSNHSRVPTGIGRRRLWGDLCVRDHCLPAEVNNMPNALIVFILGKNGALETTMAHISKLYELGRMWRRSVLGTNVAIFVEIGP